ncbi:MAG: hypothetical protein M1827_002697 [Pycnora praestabilis]|nr:MAG: hypothetical protein M1827_002697 [Pycnora praestabilis]
MLAVTAYLVRGLQLVLGTSKRAMTERAEEMGNEDDEIPLTQRTRGNSEATARTTTTISSPLHSPEPLSDLISPPRAQDPNQVRGTGGPPAEVAPSQITLPQSRMRQEPTPLSRSQRWAAIITVNLDVFTYGTIFLCLGIPVYYGTGYAMPIQLSLNILAYFAALSLPAKYRQFLHPVLVSSVITILGIWILALCRRDSLRDGLTAYSTKTRYLQLWDGDEGLQKPGAGDVFGSVLDVSIVALALPMFQYRNELKRHFLSIILPNLVISISSLFGYPALCTTIGISPPRSLSFAARSLTLALATPATQNLGGDLNLVAVLCIMSGILGVLIGPLMLKWLRIPEDDYVTRGVALGGNSSAIATALLLVSDPRAAALSSLSMSLFGTSMVALTSVPPVVTIVAQLAGLEGKGG